MKRFDLTIPFALCCLLAGCTSAPRLPQRDPYQPEWELPADSIAVPLINQRGYQWLVNVEVDRVPGVFILDTGADHTLITPQFARKAGLWENSTAGRIADQQNSSNEVRFALVVSLKLGEAVYRKFYAPIVNLDHINNVMNAPIDGILGNNALNQTAWRIDGRLNTLFLLFRSTEPPQGSIPITIRDGHIYTEVLLNGRATEFALDTGAYRTTIAAKELARLQIPREKQREVEAPTIDILRAQDEKQIDVTLDSLRLGNISRTNYSLRVWDHNALGMDLLGRRVLMVDALQHWMSLSEPVEAEKP